ncbi:MAG: mechanosensitive ion channel family protein [Thaumarchaeota archaeon]|nr:mechanosensitive ion channel family protein [Nitrososphaerota archaeon]MCL5318748.1 mechanosensitive ion channel family protein [Nitrososphaerota archaeon]
MAPPEYSRDGFKRSVVELILFILLYTVTIAFVSYLLNTVFPSVSITPLPQYVIYVNILVTLALGYLIASTFSDIVYWSIRRRYDYPTAMAVKNLIKLLAVGAMVSAIAGGVAGGAAGVSLAGFLALVVGFASQQVSGQIVAGFFLLLVRPFRVGDPVKVVDEEGIVSEVGILFTTIVKADGVRTLIPNGMLVNAKIYLRPKAKT